MTIKVETVREYHIVREALRVAAQDAGRVSKEAGRVRGLSNVMARDVEYLTWAVKFFDARASDFLSLVDTVEMS